MIDSFIIDHWASVHGTQVLPPRFKFAVVSSHKDALTRQLMEAILIRKGGKLNKRIEYNSNEIIKMEYTNDRDKLIHCEKEIGRAHV